jgi:nucleoside-diphosphate-sugar epimerase
LEILAGDITDLVSLPHFEAVDTVLLAVAKDINSQTDPRSIHVEGLNNVLRRLSDETRQLIYISTTGVYGNQSEPEPSAATDEPVWVDESTPPIPDRPAGRACLEAESIIQSGAWASRATILRFAGIYGPGRVPLLQAIAFRQWDQLNPTGYLNLIHADDGAGIIVRVADLQLGGKLFLVSDGVPVTRRKFYECLAQKINAGPIVWDLTKPTPQTTWPARRSGNKRVSNRKLIRATGYHFLYADYETGLNSLFVSEQT